MIRVDVANEQAAVKVDRPRLVAAIQSVLRAEGFRSATISLAIVDDATIQALNRRWLRHDYPTDVLSFLLDEAADSLDGEIVVSGETAAASAPRFAWSAGDELLLYVIHGALHLAGYDDQSPEDRRRMRQREREFLARLGLAPHGEGPDADEARTRTPGAARQAVEGSKP
jgi:probable rRNA maturation factor